MVREDSDHFVVTEIRSKYRVAGASDPIGASANLLDPTGTDQALLAAINAASGGLINKLLSPLLNTIGATVDQILGATTVAVDTVLEDHLVALTGQYVSLPKLRVTVPAKNPPLPTGTYRGTLVVTGVQ